MYNKPDIDTKYRKKLRKIIFKITKDKEGNGMSDRQYQERDVSSSYLTEAELLELGEKLWEIRKSRNESSATQTMLWGVMFFLCLVFSFVESNDRWIAIIGVVLCVIWGVYLFKYYDRHTAKLESEAIRSYTTYKRKNPKEK